MVGCCPRGHVEAVWGNVGLLLKQCWVILCARRGQPSWGNIGIWCHSAHGVILGSYIGSFCYNFGVILVPFGVIMVSVWGSFWCHSWVIRGHSGVILVSFWNHSGSFLHSGVICGSYSGHVGVILLSFWGHVGVMLGSGSSWGH